MELNSSSSSSDSSCAPFSSFDEISVKTNDNSVKFLYSYGGKILPRHSDGKLRYLGGDTRVLSVDRNITYSELEMKLKELCGWEMLSIRCQLPNEDLDALVSIRSNEDLANLIEEYDFISKDNIDSPKIRAFVYDMNSTSPNFIKKTTGKYLSPRSPFSPSFSKFSGGQGGRCFKGNMGHYRRFLVHQGSHWQ